MHVPKPTPIGILFIGTPIPAPKAIQIGIHMRGFSITRFFIIISCPKIYFHILSKKYKTLLDLFELKSTI